jgi:hypothetical protein
MCTFSYSDSIAAELDSESIRKHTAITLNSLTKEQLMKAGKTMKSVFATCAILALPLSAFAGGGHIWAKKQQHVNLEQNMTLNSAVEKNIRYWARYDFNSDGRISATEMQHYLNDKFGLNGFDTAELPVGLAGLADDKGSKPLSSADLGMHYAHGPGKDNPSTKVFIPGVAYTEVMPKEASNNKNFNKRAMVLEIQEAMLEKEDNAM